MPALGASVQIVQVCLPEQQRALHGLSLDYFKWLANQFEEHFKLSLTQLVGQSLDDYVAQTQQSFLQQSADDGAFYLLRQGDDYIAMAGLRRLSGELAELKRFYLCPALRGQGYASMFLDFLIQRASHLGYKSLLLDSAPFMHEAHRFYLRQGFTRCQAYSGTEVPQLLQQEWIFMQRDLSAVSA